MIAETLSSIESGSFVIPSSDRCAINEILSGGTHRIRVIYRLQILMKWEEKYSISTTIGVLPVSRSTVFRTRKKYKESGLKWILYDKSRSGRSRKISSVDENHLTALACSLPPRGRTRWTITLLYEQMKKRFSWPGSRSSVWISLVRHGLQPWRKRMWCLPEITDTFIERMMTVLETYERPYNPRFPVLCFDEKSHQLTAHQKPPQLMTENHEYREDYHYDRLGTVNFFVVVEPLGHRRFIFATRRRTKRDFALVIKRLLETYSTSVERITIVLDNLNTHTADSLRAHFPPETADTLLKKIEWIHTPNHASWLNMAENEISVLERQCLGKRFQNVDELLQEVQIWMDDRNDRAIPIKWLFTRARAREKFKLSPRSSLREVDAPNKALQTLLPAIPISRAAVDEFWTGSFPVSSTKNASVRRLPISRSREKATLLQDQLANEGFPEEVVNAVKQEFIPKRLPTVLTLLLILWQKFPIAHPFKTIVDETRLSLSTVRKIVKELDALGFVTTYKEPRQGRGRSRHLTILKRSFHGKGPP